MWEEAGVLAAEAKRPLPEKRFDEFTTEEKLGPESEGDGL